MNRRSDAGRGLHRKRMAAACFALCLAGASWLRAAESSSNWTGFQDGGRVQVKQLPESWNSDGTNIAWSADIEGYGQSSPVVYGNHVYITSTSGPSKDKYHLACLSLADGKKQWQLSFDNPTPVENNSYVSRAAPSPVVTESAVIASFEGGIAVAVSHAGNVIWQKNLVNEYGAITSRHGLAASLEQDDKSVYIWIERDAEPYLLALRKTDGAVAWKVDGLGATSWASPRLINVASKPHLVCSASGRIVGFHPEDGRRLWEFTELSNNTTCTPIPIADGRFLIGASEGRTETPGQNPAASNGVIEVTAQTDGSFQVGYVWRAEKAASSFGSPIVAAGSVWIVNRSGALYQLDAATGKQQSIGRTAAGSIWATPLATSEKLYLFGQKGTTSIIDLKSAKEVQSCSTWSGGNQETPAASGGQVLYAAVAAGPDLLIRRGDKLFAVRQK
ncbi:MAG: PQQ-binding-like beta-propeller repeat protein [Pirellulales bacterium]